MTLIAPLLLTLLGQADSPAELSPMQVTAGRQESSVFDVSRAVSVVDREQLEIATPLIPADLLRGVPGVYLQQTTPGQGIPIIRGLKGSENLHLVDGFRLNNAFFRNAPNQYLALVPATNLERVEVVRGPASALYGSDAMGGAVQLITRQPEFGTPIRYESRLQMSSADHAITASGAVEGGDQNSAWRLHAALQDVGDRKTARGTVSPSAYQARSLATSYRQQANEHLEWRVDVQAVRQPSTPRVDELLPGFGQDEADSAEFRFEPNQRTFVHGILQGDDLPIADRWQVHLGYQQIRDDRRSRNTGSNQRRLENNSSDLWGLTAQFDRLIGGWSLVYGFEHYRDKVESDRRGVDILDATTQDLIARFPDGSTQRSSAMYANAEFHPGLRDTVTVGGRFSDLGIDLAQADRPAGAKLDESEFTLSLGWQRELRQGVHLSANAGEGFRAPNIFDLSTLGERPGNRFNVANVNLQPEHLRSLDIGIKWQGRSVQAELFGFYSRFDDKISSVATGEITADGRVVVRSENLAEVDLYGLEFGGRWSPAPTVKAYATLNWIHGEERGANGFSQPADRVPPLNGRLGVNWEFGHGLHLDTWSDFSTNQDRLSDRDLSDPRINPLGTPGWATLNARVDWRADATWRFGLTMENLLDNSYREHGSGIDALGINATLLVSATWQ